MLSHSTGYRLRATIARRRRFNRIATVAFIAAAGCGAAVHWAPYGVAMVAAVAGYAALMVAVSAAGAASV